MNKRSVIGLYGYLFLAVSLCGFLFFYILPLIWGGMQLFFEGGCFIAQKGVNVFVETLQSESFRLALKNTGLFIAVCVPVLLGVALLLTFCVDISIQEKRAWISFWIAVLLLPMILPSAAIVQVMEAVFSAYLLEADGAFWLLCAVYWWKNAGYIMVVLLSGRNNIPYEQREAAQLEGAGEWRIFRSVIIPQLAPFLRFSVVMGVAGVFKIYRESFLLLGNYPQDEVYMLQNFLNNNFASWNYERAVAASLILFAIIMVFWASLFRRKAE